MSLKENYQQLILDINKKDINGEEAIFKLLKEEASAEEIADAIWKILEEVFSLILSFIKENYPSISAEGIDIISCLWSGDDLTIADRVETALTRPNPLPHLCLIAENESFEILNSFMTNTVSKEAKFFEVIQTSKCCEFCDEQYLPGIHPIGELNEIPPFHVDCQCGIIYYME